MGKVIGIDLGTTNSVAAVVDGPQIRVLDNRDNRPSTRSVVGLRHKKGKADEVLVGDVAVANWPMAPKDTILSIKRLMGRGVADPEVQKIKKESLYEVVEPSDGTRDSVRVLMGGKQYSPVEISAMILKKIKEDAEFRLGEEVTDAVITVPAYFSQAQKAATRLAGQQAGMRVIKVLDEPTAASIAYGVDSAESTEPKYILVYDLGGGTFDISVLMWAGNVFAPLTLEGDMWLGGDNFDQAIVDRAVAYIREEYGVDPTPNLRCMAMLKKAAQEAKERLAASRTADIIIASALADESGNLLDVEMEITREQFEDWIRPQVAKTITLTEKALASAGLSVDQIAHVIMAGNSTCVPLVQQEVEKTFGTERVQRKMHPKLSVAQGAAKVAAVLYGKIVCQAPDPSDASRECGHVNKQDVPTCEKCGAPLGEAADKAAEDDELIPPGGIAPFSYGIQVKGDRFDVFIRKNAPFPTPEEQREPQTKHTHMANQRQINMPVYGGDNLDKASANDKQGEAVAILPPGLPVHTPVRIRLWLDSDGVFELSAHLEDGTDLKPWIMKGEVDQKAIEMLQRIEQDFENVEHELGTEEREALDKVRNDAFEDMRSHRFDQAMNRAQEFKDKLGQRQAPDPLRQKAENLLGFAQFVLQRYGWTFDVTKQYQFQQLVEQTREALEGGDRAALEKKVAELDKITDQLPKAAQLFVNMFMAIQSRIRPVDPVEASNLLDELDGVESAFKAKSPQAQAKLSQFAAKLAVAMDQIGGAGPGVAKKPQRCSAPGCGALIPVGAAKCPKCKLPVTLLDGGAPKSSTIR